MHTPDDARFRDPVIEACKARIARTLLRAQLERTVDGRVHYMLNALALAEPLRDAGRYARAGPADVEARDPVRCQETCSTSPRPFVDSEH